MYYILGRRDGDTSIKVDHRCKYVFDICVYYSNHIATYDKTGFTNWVPFHNQFVKENKWTLKY